MSELPSLEYYKTSANLSLLMSIPKIIVALDYPDAKSALAFTNQVSADLCALKVGSELFTAAGPTLIEQLVDQGFKVFLDLKYHDIPNTVANACRAAASLGVWMLTVHALGGERMLVAARAAIDGIIGEKPLLIGVTMLTSLAASELGPLGMSGILTDNVLRLAKLSQQAQLDGVVCSAQEISMIREACGETFCLVTPGIRPRHYNKQDDQRRTLTPVEAMAAGANYLVIGRPITQASDPVQTLLTLRESLYLT